MHFQDRSGGPVRKIEIGGSVELSNQAGRIYAFWANPDAKISCTMR